MFGWMTLNLSPSTHFPLMTHRFSLFYLSIGLTASHHLPSLTPLISPPRRNGFRGLSLSLVQLFLRQILDSLSVLRDASIIHCDLKPENILLSNATSGEIKLIDFGSACFESRTVYSYIQSRFYRSPEVVLGSSYNVSIDMWSLGCVAAELFLGLPLFPGSSEHDLMVSAGVTPWLSG